MKTDTTRSARAIAAPLSLVLALAGTPAAAAITIVPVETGGSTRVSESGARDYYALALPEAPAAGETVTISLVPSANLTFSPRDLTFTDANWDRPQTITVSAVNDATPEGDKTEPVGHQVFSAGLPVNRKYDGATVQPLGVAIADNDQLGITVAEPDGATEVREGGTSDYYTVVLTGQPAGDVKVTIRTERELTARGAQVAVQPTVLTFTPQNYATAQTVTVTAVNDPTVEAASSETLHHTVESSDSAYNLYPARDLRVAILDNDGADVVIGESGGSTRVAEGGMSDSYTLVLTARPSNGVSIVLTAEADAAVSPASVTFTSSNWSQPQLITVTALDDREPEGPHAGRIDHKVNSADAGYNGLAIGAVTAAITDNDGPAVVLNETGGATRVAEGGAEDAYTVVLSQRPSADVTVTLHAGDQLAVQPSVIKFSAADFSVARTVTVRAVDDRVVEDPRVSTVAHDVASGDFAYDRLPADELAIDVADNDARGVAIVETGGATALTEGGSADSYTLALTARPDTDVRITVASPDAGVRVTPEQLVFTADNFLEPQAVSVEAPDDDAVAEAGRLVTLTHGIATADAAYAAVAPGAVQVDLSDNDSPGIALRQSDLATAVAEGGRDDTYEIVLLSQPVADVTIAIEAGDQLRAEPATLTFTAGDYATPQPVRLTAVDDAVAQGSRLALVSHAASSEDANYRGPGAQLQVAVGDNDVAGLRIVEPAGPAQVSEAGATVDYTFALASEPVADVTIAFEAGEQLRASPATLTFTPSNWNVPQTVTLEAVDDAAVEEAQAATLGYTSSSADGTYDGMAGALTATIADNDAAAQSAPGGGGGALSWLTLAALLLGARRRGNRID